MTNLEPSKQDCVELAKTTPRWTTIKNTSQSSDLLLSEEERKAIPKGYHFLLEYKEELDYLLDLQLAKVQKRIDELENRIASLQNRVEAERAKTLKEVEQRLDSINFEQGNETRLCIFCGSNVYNHLGINHEKDCPIVWIRAQLKSGQLESGT